MRLSGSSTRSRSSIEKIESFNQNYTEKEKDPTTFLCCWRLYVAGRGRSVRCFTGPTMDRSNLWRMYTIMNLIIVFHNWNWIPLRIILKIIVFNFNILCGTQHWNVKIYFSIFNQFWNGSRFSRVTLLLSRQFYQFHILSLKKIKYLK